MIVSLKEKNVKSKSIEDIVIYLEGGFWDNGRYYTDQNGCQRLYQLNKKHLFDATFIQNTIQSFNGSFMFCIQSKNVVIAAVDHVRSYPLFFSNDMLTDLLSPENEIDYLGKIEFLSSSYTVNNRTVFSRWKSLLPGEYLCWESGRTIVRRYYEHTHNIDKMLNEEEILVRFKQINEAVISRTVQSLQGKKVLIGLSGGFDSRYIACMLKEYGMRDVIAYTYGKRTSYEVKTSREVAAKLGYKWHFSEYTNGFWTDLEEHHIIDDFISFSFRGDGSPCLQEIPVLYELSKQYDPSEYCIIPGYCGDLFGGSYLFPHKSEEINTQEMAMFLYEKHFLFRRNSSKDRQDIFTDLKSKLASDGTMTYGQAASFNEDWFVQHKVAKFVVNAVRMFEFFGYEWRLPLWDNQLTELWYSVPLTFRGINKNLYHELLYALYFDKYDVTMGKPASFSKKPSSGIMLYMKNLIKTVNSYSVIHNGIHLIPGVDINNFETIDRIMFNDIHDHRRINYGKVNGNAYVARKVMEKIEENN